MTSLKRFLSTGILLPLSVSLACAFLLASPSGEHRSIRPAHIDTAFKYINVREKTGKNDGAEVEKFLRLVHLGKGYAWCAAFVSYCLDVAHVVTVTVRSAMARSFVVRSSIRAQDVLSGKYKVKAGDLLIWFKGKTVYGHIEMSVDDWPIKVTKSGTHFTDSGPSIGGNTNRVGSRDGDGVYVQTRQIQPYNYFSIRYITPV